VFTLYLVGMAPLFNPAIFPGDLGDSRFNMYVLEHGYRWLTGVDKSFWSAPFYYPVPNVITYSDNHLGSFLIYSAFRFLGQDRETAFQLWCVALFTLNYFVTYFVLRKQEFHWIGAMATAYVFTFPTIMIAQGGHMQLAPRFMVPVAFWMVCRFLDGGEGKYLRCLLLAVAYQIYVAIYIGFFLALMLVPFCLCLFIVRKQWIGLWKFVRSQSGLAGGARLSDSTELIEVSPKFWPYRRVLLRGIDYGVSACCFYLALLPLAIPYSRTQREFGLRRWEDIIPMLPRWQSYLHAPMSYLWGNILQAGKHLPMASEHLIFPGALTCVAALIFMYLASQKKLSENQTAVGLAMLGAFLSIGLVTLYVSGYSLYWFVWKFLPGAAAIRAVSRYMLVGIYPLAFIFGALLSWCAMNRKRFGPAWMMTQAGVTATLLFAVVDQAAPFPSTTKSECRRRVVALKEAVERKRGNDEHFRVLWVNQDHGAYAYLQNLDAMLVGQELNLEVVNGFSGLAPMDYPTEMMLSEPDCRAALTAWLRTHPGAYPNDSVLEVGPQFPIPNDYLPVPNRGLTQIEPLGDQFHLWAIDRKAEMRLVERTNRDETYVVAFDLATLRERNVWVTTPDEREQVFHLVPGFRQHVRVQFVAVSPKSKIFFRTDADGVGSEGETRTLFFDVENPVERKAEVRRQN
jgi:hypothetical protein